MLNALDLIVFGRSDETALVDIDERRPAGANNSGLA